MVAEKLGKTKINKSDKQQKKTWRKSRIQANIADWKKVASRLDGRRKVIFELEKKDLDGMERNYKLSDVGNLQNIDMLKEKNVSRYYKDKTYEERELHYHQNLLFLRKQRQYYEERDGRSNIPNEALMFKKLQNLGTIHCQYMEILTKMLHGSPR